MPAESPIACDLSALDPAERERRGALAARIGRGLGVRELSDGYAIRLREDAWLAAAEFVALERRCCPFLAFALEAEAEGGDFWLRLTGREGVKDFLRREFESGGERRSCSTD